MRDCDPTSADLIPHSYAVALCEDHPIAAHKLHIGKTLDAEQVLRAKRGSEDYCPAMLDDVALAAVRSDSIPASNASTASTANW